MFSKPSLVGQLIHVLFHSNLKKRYFGGCLIIVLPQDVRGGWKLCGAKVGGRGHFLSRKEANWCHLVASMASVVTTKRPIGGNWCHLVASILLLKVLHLLQSVGLGWDEEPEPED